MRPKEQLVGLGLGHRLHGIARERSARARPSASAIARATLGRPALLLADEPTSSLDDANAELVLQLLTEQAVEHGAALLVVTHDARIRGRLEPGDRARERGAHDVSPALRGPTCAPHPSPAP